MEIDNQQKRNNTFLTELKNLSDGKYITEEQYTQVRLAYHQYSHDLRRKKEESLLYERRQAEHVGPPPIPDSAKNLLTSKKKTLPFSKPKLPERKKLTAEEIRERNISWLLSLGVILLLIGGLYLATSNWETMTDMMKSGMVGLVSLLFFGIAFASYRILKINKTGFAFMVLASLFLPIFLLSVGWFKLLGEYLSLTGEGGNLFGFISCVLLIPLYVFFANKLKSRVFVWFSFLGMTVGTTFLLSFIGLEQDWFYFGIMLYNVLAVVFFHRFKKKQAFKLFTNELVSFTQIQLVVSSLLTLVFFDNQALNGLNILLSAAVYIAMVYVSGRKEYHFIFSTMIVYGSFQLIEHSVLDDFGPILYVLIAIGFLTVPRILDDRFQWKKIFQLTSAVVSLLVFLTISIEAILMNVNEASWALLLAYLLLSGQFIYLANMVHLRLFRYLSPIFLLAMEYQALLLIDEVIHFRSFIVPMFLIGFLLFMSFGYYIKYKTVNVIRHSSRDVAFVVMGFVLLISEAISTHFDFGILLLLFSVTLYLAYREDERSFYKISLPWVLPLAVASAFTSFGEEISTGSEFYRDNLGFSMSAIFGSIVSFLAFFVWKRLKEESLAKNFFYIGQIVYTLAILNALNSYMNEIWMRPLVLLVGIVVYLWFYKQSKLFWLPFLISIVTLASYFTVTDAIERLVELPHDLHSFEYVLAAVILFAIYYLVKNKDSKLANSFAWVGHLYLPLALFITLVFYFETALWGFMLATLLYSISVLFVQAIWKRMLYLYAAFTSLYMSISTGMAYWDLKLDYQYSFLITSFIIALFWLLSKPGNKKQTMYYFVPFSMLGIISFIISYSYDLEMYAVTLIYAVGLLVFLAVTKWKIISIIPTLFIYSATMKYLIFVEFSSELKLLLIASLGVAMVLIGMLLYKRIVEKDEKGRIAEIDGYTITSVLFFIACYGYQTEAIWTFFLPGILISLTLYLQKTRVPEQWSIWVAIGSGVYLLQPYYATMSQLTIPDLWEREVIVLPWLGVVIFLQRSFKGRFSKFINQLQWSVLIIISLLLVQDGLESSQVADALILGTLSLISLLAGMFLKIKSYFFVGSGVLLLNVFLQTRPFWGKLPWWMYLLIVGSLLIAVASYNEWQKQKTSKGEATLLSKVKEKAMTWFKRWE